MKNSLAENMRRFGTKNLNESQTNNYMFWQNLKTIAHAATEMLKMNQDQIDTMIANGHAWAVDHVSSSADDMEEVYHFIEANLSDNKEPGIGDLNRM